MRKKLPKVLMLGWEFPPLINGGLGVACHDLSSALSELAEVTMIVPKASPGFKVNQVNLIGINNLEAKSYETYFNDVHRNLPFSLHGIPADLNPYYSQEASNENALRLSRPNSGNRAFDIDNLYGNDVIQKVQQFADITAAYTSEMDFDVIHAHDWMTMMAGIQIKQKTGKPLVLHIHSLEIDRSGPQSKGWLYELEKKGMEHADLLMPVSNFTANNISTYYGIDSSKMNVVHNGSAFVKPFRTRKTYPEKTVLFVGRLTRQKGPEKFLEIASRVLDKNLNVRFVMAGVGEHYKGLIEQSSYRQLGHRFHLTGFLNSQKLHHLLSISDVYCMPSVSEPFGLSAVEAAQFGVPCVISKQSGVAEVLTGSLKFDFWDIDKAADCILNLINNPVLRKKVVKDAKENLSNINWNLSAKKVIQAYSNAQFI